MAPIAEAFVRARVDGRGFGPELDRTISNSSGHVNTSKHGKKLGLGLSKGIGGGMRLGMRGALAPLAAGFAALGGIHVFKGFVDDARESAKVGALTAQVIKTTGGAAHLTTKQITSLATAISNKTGIDDDAVQASENLLLTFTNVRNEVGRGNKVFDRATGLVQDMSVALGQDGKAGAIQLGKALNDPVKGITALSRVGVSFTEKQKKQIARLVEHNKTLKAQKVILKELGKEFGGAAAAAATPMDKLKTVLKNLGETLGTKLLPYLDQGAQFASEFVTQMANGTGRGGAFVAKLRELVAQAKAFWEIIQPLVGVLRSLLGFVAGLPGPLIAAAGAFLLVKSAVGGIGDKLGAMNGKFKESKGATTGFRGNLKGLMGFVGGPWTLAITAGTIILGNYLRKHIESKARVDALKESLDKETGAITAVSRAETYATLVKNGAVAGARTLGISLKDLTDAALGNVGAQKRVNQAVADANKLLPKATGLAGAKTGANVQLSKTERDLAHAAGQVSRAVSSGNKELQQARTDAANAREALNGLKDAATKAGTAFTAGLAAGIRKGGDVSVAAAEGVARRVAAATRAGLEVKSPSRVGIRIGGSFSEGIAVGITLKGKKAVEAAKTLIGNVKSHLADLKSQARDIASAAADSVRGVLDISQVGAPGTTPGGVLAGFAAQAKAFAKALAKMAKIGLAPAIIAAVAAAGPSALGAANAFAGESKAQVRADNAASATIDRAARSAGATARASSGIDKKIDATNHILRQLHHALTSGKVGEIEIRNGKVFIKYVNDANHQNHRRGHQ